MESSVTGATGIGGDTSFLGTYEIPVGVAGCSGVLTLSVTEKNLPPLLLPVRKYLAEPLLHN